VATLSKPFLPNVKLVEKTRININSKYRKKYDKPKTPYQRVMESKQISKRVKQQLKAVHLSLYSRRKLTEN